MKVGDYQEVTRVFTKAELSQYLRLGGGPASEVPEPLIGALFSYLLGVKLPGLGTNYLKQDTEFLATAQLGEVLTARVEITRIRPEKHLVDLHTTCRSENGHLLTRGRALVYIKDVK